MPGITPLTASVVLLLAAIPGGPAEERFERLRPAILGLAIERSAEGDAYRVVDAGAGGATVIARGTQEECERALLETLEARHGKGRWNVPFATLGGKQFWADQLVCCRWRIQENVYTGHCRLLDPDDVRQAWGTFEACRVALERARVERGLRPRSEHLVVLVHGLLRSGGAFAPMAEALEDRGYEVAAVNYPSTRRRISEHADQLEKVLEAMEGARTVSFVTHSLGGLVVRELLARDAPWERRIAVRRLVLLGPPNRGSLVAEVLKDWFPFRLVTGEVGQELTPENVDKVPLPACDFGIIAGGTGDGEGLNPLLPGDDDGVVTVDSTRLEGAKDFLVLPVLHGTMMRDDAVIAATIRFLESGTFSGARADGPPARPAAASSDPSRDGSPETAPWHHRLSLDGGGWWRRRVPLEVRNGSDREAEGTAAFVRIGRGPGEADLEGRAAEAIRVVSGDGAEMLWSLRGPAGEPVLRGPVPAGSVLALPVECGPRSAVRYFVYSDNPSAWEVPDVLDARDGILNGGMEDGAGDESPAGWSHETADARHRASWTRESPRSGSRCLKTEVDRGAEATWVQTRQGGISVRGGDRYILRGWVRGRDVAGSAGWYIHLGDDANPMAGNHVVSAGDGTFEWKEIALELAAPPGARFATVGTVLHGTGTAWFDDVSLEAAGPPSMAAKASAPEDLRLEPPAPAAIAWHEETAAEAAGAWDRRSRVRLVPPSGAPGPRTVLVHADAGKIASRLRRPLDGLRFRAVADGRAAPHARLGSAVLFEAPLDPGREPALFVYCGAAAPGERPEEPPFPEAPWNLVRNPSFEDGEGRPASWTASGDGGGGVELSLDAPGRLGGRCARLHVPRSAPLAWRGWTQDVPVEPGASYLYAAWVRCRDLQGAATLHAHFRMASGDLIEGPWAVSTGEPISGTTEWTLLSGCFEIPPGAATFQVHLTMEGTGTLWHDGVVVARVERGTVGPIESRDASEPQGPTAWPVNAVVKVFREDLPPERRGVSPAVLHVARNEKEPLQVALRSPSAVPGVRVRVDPPTHASGARIEDVEVAVVGYVPIDHETSYYTAQGPRWRRMVPTAPGACDGWPGLWPDPLLPRSGFDLEARATQPVWVTFGVAEGAPAGEYRSAVRFEAGDRTIAEVPVAVKVRDVTLPRTTAFKAIYDLRVGERWKVPGRSDDETWRDLCRFLAARRLCPDTIQPAPRIAWKDGRVEADFSGFDRSAELCFEELRLPHAYTPWEFYLFGWGFPPSDRFGERPYEGSWPFEGADRSKLRPEFRRAYQACLRAFWDHLRARGWDSRCILYISDEPFFRERPILEQMRALCDMIHEVDPAIPIYSSTWHHVPEWDGKLDVWGISHHGLVSPERIAEIRSRGARILWTTDGQMCTDTPYCAVERLLPWYAFRHGAEGYEFWGVTWLTHDPWRFGWHAYIPQSDTPGKSYFIRYPNGDGFLAYPGGPIGHPGPVSSVRLEQAREGVEDHEHLRILAGLVAEGREAGRDVSGAEAVLADVGGLVPIPNAGGRYSTRILPDPDVLPRLKERIDDAIEGLSAKPVPRGAGVRRSVLWRSGTGGYHTYRIPAAVATPSGAVLAFCEGRKRGQGDSGDIDLLVRRSADGGQTWDDQRVVWDDGGNTCGNPAPVVDRKSGTIWLLLTWNLGTDREPEIIARKSKDTRRVFVTRSTDEGGTWETPREITARTKRPDWTWYATGPGAGIQVERGPFRGRLIIPCDHIEGDTKRYRSHVIWSDDGGATWALGGATPRDQVNECQVVELTGGRLLLNSRNYDRSKRTRQVSVSSDGGGTWSEPRHDPALIEPICQASLRRVAWEGNDGKGILAFSNPASETARVRMTVRLSPDEGATWPAALVVHEGPSAYSDLVVLPDGDLGCLHEAGEKGPYETIVLARFPMGAFDR